MAIHSSYMHPIFNIEQFPNLVESVITSAKLLMDKHPYDTIAFTGNSGSALAYILSFTLKIPLICVRKPGEDSHFIGKPSTWFPIRDRDLFEGNLSCKNYIIIDDGISSGKSVKKIRDVIDATCASARCVAMLMYMSPPHFNPANNTWEPMEQIVPSFNNPDLWQKNVDGIPVYGCNSTK